MVEQLFKSQQGVFCRYSQRETLKLVIKNKYTKARSVWVRQISDKGFGHENRFDWQGCDRKLRVRCP